MTIKTNMAIVSEINTGVIAEFCKDKNFSVTISNGEVTVTIDDEYVMDMIRFFNRTFMKVRVVTESIISDGEKICKKYYSEQK